MFFALKHATNQTTPTDVECRLFCYPILFAVADFVILSQITVLSAHSYTGVRFADIANDVEQTIATLDKSLTVEYSGTPISITKIDAVQNTEAGYSGNEVYFDLTLTTDTDLDGSASYVLFEVFDDGAAMGNTVYGSERCCEVGTAYPAGETVTFYLMKVTGSVGEGGNATLTYTPMGDGYTWTVPSAS